MKIIVGLLYGYAFLQKGTMHMQLITNHFFTQQALPRTILVFIIADEISILSWTLGFSFSPTDHNKLVSAWPLVSGQQVNIMCMSYTFAPIVVRCNNNNKFTWIL